MNKQRKVLITITYNDMGIIIDTKAKEVAQPVESEPACEDAISREEYEETDGVIKIKKKSAEDVGEIKHIVVCSPNYTRYFYSDSMPTPCKGGDKE